MIVARRSIRELAREYTIEALDVLVPIMLNEKAPPNARVAAANTLLDRAYGKAPTFSTTDPGTNAVWRIAYLLRQAELYDSLRLLTGEA